MAAREAYISVSASNVAMYSLPVPIRSDSNVETLVFQQKFYGKMASTAEFWPKYQNVPVCNVVTYSMHWK